MVIERGYKPFVVIRPENDASRNLYTKLGFTKAYETCRVKLMPYVHKTSSAENNTNGSCGLYKPSAPESEIENDNDNQLNSLIEKVIAVKEKENIEDMLKVKCTLNQKNEDDEPEVVVASMTDDIVKEN